MIYDVVVIGGGAAGLSGALTLARARRSVLVVDAGQPRNAPAAGVHNFLTSEGMSPSALLGAGRAEVGGYGGEVLAGTVTSAARESDGFALTLGDGRIVRARRLLVTTGLVDELPNIPGVRERWGRDVLHCPYCHGWEVRDQALGVLGTGPMAVHQTLLFGQLSSDVTLFVHTAPQPTPDEQERLAARGVTVVTGEVAALEVTDDRLTGVRMAGGEVVPRDAVVVGPRFVARAAVLSALGVEVTEHPFGTYVAADPMGQTAIPGVWVAGNVTDPTAQVIVAAADGLRAAAAINADLVEEDVKRAVTARRAAEAPAQDNADRHDASHHDHHDQKLPAGSDPAGGSEIPEFDEAFWDGQYRSRPALWSGAPNAPLVDEVAELTPGTALDAGTGEGADALWLARRGWQVTAVDISQVALERAAAHATAEDAAAAAHIAWVHADVTSWVPAEKSFDLVSVQYLHTLPGGEGLYDRLTAAVAPGGTLLVVGHHPSDLETTVGRWRMPELMFTAEEMAATLDTDAWQVVVCEARPRRTPDPEGHEITVRDTVLRARRREMRPSPGPRARAAAP